MNIRIHTANDYVQGNTQSCKDLVDYLEKENEGKSFVEKENFFNQSSLNIDSNLVINKIDYNKKGLKDKDIKFFAISISPSPKELKHIAAMASEGKLISHISDFNSQELEKYNLLIKDYSKNVMGEYAKSFDRDITSDDLLYYGKLEQKRHYNGTDNKVLEGKVKSGEEKPGLQTHVHIVVSRKDVTQKMSLSPLANSRGSSNHVLNGKSVKVGFDRDKFISNCEALFDKDLNYNREFQNSYEYYKFRASPLSYVSSLASANPSGLKNAATMSIDQLTKTQIASNISKVSAVSTNPEAAKHLLVNKLEQAVTSFLPPQLKIAKKIIKPIIKVAKGM